MKKNTMQKLSEEFWNSVNPSFVCLNELVVLPESGDCGFVEYFDYKAEVVKNRKKIYSIVDNQSKLMLEFPDPDHIQKDVFKLFFESPSVVAQNQKFEGLFGIDISNYVNKLDHDRFSSLISYIKANPEIVFVLFFYSDNQKEIYRVHGALMKHIDIIKTVLPEPAAAQLLSYTMEGMTNLCQNLEDGIEEYLNDFFTNNSVGYDSADYLLRHLKLSHFGGTLKEVREMLSILNIQMTNSDKYVRLGY